MFIGFIFVGLRGDPSSRRAHWLVLVVIVVVLSYEAVKIHAV
jgi:hypothetical protein